MKKKAFVLILFLIIVLMGIGYSYLSTSLSVNGYINVTSPAVSSIMHVDNNVDEIADVGEIIKIGTEEFYVISRDAYNIKAIAKYNLYVGNVSYDGENYSSLVNPTGRQSSAALGWVDWTLTSVATTAYSDASGNNLVTQYLTPYETYLETFGVDISNISLITWDELVNLGCSNVDPYPCTGAPSWVYSTSYWTGNSIDSNNEIYVGSNGLPYYASFDNAVGYGVRPVITIPRTAVEPVHAYENLVISEEATASHDAQANWTKTSNSIYINDLYKSGVTHVSFRLNVSVNSTVSNNDQDVQVYIHVVDKNGSDILIETIKTKGKGTNIYNAVRNYDVNGLSRIYFVIANCASSVPYGASAMLSEIKINGSY